MKSVEGVAGSIANAETPPVGKAPVTAQLWPPSVLFKTPALVPANSVDAVLGTMVSTATLAASGPIAVQRFTAATAGKDASAKAKQNRCAETTEPI